MKRFWDKVNKTDGCWLWTGSRDRKGYGRISIDRSPALVHRVAWTLEHGAIPPGMCVLHKCDTPGCVRHDHLFLGTIADNNRDMFAKGRAYPQTKPKNTHCLRGHALTPENKRGRACRTCSNDNTTRRREANPEAKRAQERELYWRNIEESRRKGREKQRLRQQRKEQARA